MPNVYIILPIHLAQQLPFNVLTIYYYYINIIKINSFVSLINTS